MPETKPPETPRRTRAELEAALPHILAAPKDGGALEMIVIRTGPGKRRVVEAAEVSVARGLFDEQGADYWERESWLTTEEGKPHPDVQLSLMGTRMIGAIAGEQANWTAAGENLFVDADFSPSNMPPGTRLQLGGAVLEVTPEPHTSCEAFIEGYGREACVFLNTGIGRKQSLRGVYARVVRDGPIRVGDRLFKLG